MTDQLVHRGPDASGQWVDEASGLGLGHRRLSIVDLSAAGCQPMESPGHRYICILNGEIYNYRDLKAELSAAGVAFRSESDTEVALAAFDRWGVAGAVERFMGMFAFAVWDKIERRLHLIRDRIGEKPLYVAELESAVLFASELKSLRVHPIWHGRIDRDALRDFFRFGYVPGDSCIYERVTKVRPGTIVTFDASSLTRSQTVYWSAATVVSRGTANALPNQQTFVADSLDRQLRETISRQMLADVPLGAFLSGGVDSSLVVAVMQALSPRPIRTFTIGFPEESFSEAVHARKVAAHLGTDHTEFTVTGDEARQVIPSLPTLYDEPFADSSQIPTHLVSALARRHVTVSLSGDGGDELFGGYDRYIEAKRKWAPIGWIPAPLRSLIARGVRSVPDIVWDSFNDSSFGRLNPVRRVNPSVDRIDRLAAVLDSATDDELYDAILSHWTRPSELVVGTNEPSAASEPQADHMDLIPRMMFRDLVGYLPDDILVKLDRAAMAVGLETRAPFLDHRMVELAWRVPMSLKLRDGKGKWILRHLLDRYVPAALTERPKMGFGVPLGEWLRGPLRNWADDLLDQTRVAREGYLDAALIARRWREHRAGQRNWQHLLWDVLMFEAWLDSHFAQSVAAAA